MYPQGKRILWIGMVWARVFVASLLLALAVFGALPARVTQAATLTVCPTAGPGCDYTTIQAAINAAASADVIRIFPGEYAENVVVDKPLTLEASDTAHPPVIYPAVSNPNPNCGGSVFCAAPPSIPPDPSVSGGSSNIILVQADNVTLSYLALNGDNPHLTSLVVIQGADIDARNGIITAFDQNLPVSATYNHLTVDHVSVANVFRSAIYDGGSGSSTTFTNNTVTNAIGANQNAIAIFTYGGTGLISHNTVNYAYDGIAAYFSRGTQISFNTVTNVVDGVFNAYNGENDLPNSVPDQIQNNRVSHCIGMGVYAVENNLASVFENNVVNDCKVGLGVLGVFGDLPPSTPVQPQVFRNNEVTGPGASTSGSRGMLITTHLGDGYYIGVSPITSVDVFATVSHNIFSNAETGVEIEAEAFTAPPPGTGIFQAGVDLNANSIAGNGSGVILTDAGGVFTVNAADNWWGNVSGPASALNSGGTGQSMPNSVPVTTPASSLVFSPWLCSGTDTQTSLVGFQPDTTCKYAIPTRLVFTTQPAGGMVGVSLPTQPVVQAQDAQGNLGYNFSGLVALVLGSNSGGSTLGGTTSVSAVHGTAAFSNLSLNHPGTGYTLVASSSGLTSATSSPFTILATTAATITGLGRSNATPNNPSSFTLTVNGNNFVSGSVVHWNGVAMATTYVSATQLSAVVPAGAIPATGQAAVTVVNPTTGTSNSFPYLGLTFNAPGGMHVEVNTTQMATIHISQAQSTPVTIALASADATIATVAVTVTIPANATSASVEITALKSGMTTITADLPAELGSGYTTLSIQTGKTIFTYLPMIIR